MYAHQIPIVISHHFQPLQGSCSATSCSRALVQWVGVGIGAASGIILVGLLARILWTQCQTRQNLSTGSISSGRRRVPMFSIRSGQFSQIPIDPIPMFMVILDNPDGEGYATGCGQIKPALQPVCTTSERGTDALDLEMACISGGNVCSSRQSRLELVPLGDDKFAALVVMPGGRSLYLAHPEREGDDMAGRSSKEVAKGPSERSGASFISCQTSVVSAAVSPLANI